MSSDRLSRTSLHTGAIVLASVLFTCRIATRHHATGCEMGATEQGIE
jgi:hypothetical protein